MEEVKLQYNLPDETLPAYEIPAVERNLPGNIRTWIHALTFRDAAVVRRLALHYTGEKQGSTDYSNLQPEEDILKICQVLIACRTTNQGAEQTFTASLGREVAAIDTLKKYLPSQVVETIVRESDYLSLSGYIPTESVEKQQEKEVAQEILLEMLGDPQVLASLNHLAIKLFAKELPELDDKNIGEYLNLLHREREMQHAIVEALYKYMEAMSAGTAGI